MASQTIKDRYLSGSYYYHPYMVNQVARAMNSPEIHLYLEDDLILYNCFSGNFFLDLIERIKAIAKKMLFKIKTFFLKSYREKFQKAVAKIVETYEAKTNNIYQTSEKAKKIQKELLAAEKDANKLKKEIDSLSLNSLYEKEDLLLLQEQKESILETIKRIQLLTGKGPLSYFNSWINQTEIVKNKNALRSLDPDFPLENMEDAIKQYEDETDNSTLLMRSIKERKTIIQECDLLIKDKQKILDHQVEKIRDLVADWKETYTYVINYNYINHINLDGFNHEVCRIENTFFESDKIKKTTQKKEEKKVLDTMLDDIKQLTTVADFSTLLRALFTHKNHDLIKGWSIEEDSSFTIQFYESLSIWYPMKDQPGGGIFMLGHNQNCQIKGSLSKNEIHFHSGFQVMGKMNIIIGAKTIKPHTHNIHYKNRLKISISGKLGPLNKTVDQTYGDILNMWNKNGIHLFKANHNELEKFLNEKYSQDINGV